MNIQRINFILINSWYHLSHSMETWVDLIWNPVLQVIVFAFIGLSLKSTGSQEAARSIMFGMIFWNVIWVGQYAIAVGALWEIWSTSFNSMMATPLTLEEFLAGQMVGGIFKAIIALAITAIFGGLIYHISVLELSWMLPIYFLELYIFSCGVGMAVLALIFKLGRDLASVSWSLIFLVQPFGAVFYPVSVIPLALQPIAWLLPTSYIFEAMREQLSTGNVNSQMLLYATILNLVYFAVGYLIIKLLFAQSKKSGVLAKIEE